VATLREQFHELSNWHNKIAISAGVTRELISDADKLTLDPKAQLAIAKAKEAFTLMERYVIGADHTTSNIKSCVTKHLGLDVENLP